jgi:hypothetical protein
VTLSPFLRPPFFALSLNVGGRFVPIMEIVNAVPVGHAMPQFDRDERVGDRDRFAYERRGHDRDRWNVPVGQMLARVR